MNAVDANTIEGARQLEKDCVSAEERFLCIIELLRNASPADRRRIVRAVAVFCDVEAP